MKRLLKSSLKLLHLEKFLVIKKEIAFIENILKYYKGYEKGNLTISKVMINKLLNDIKSLQSRIKHLEDISKGNLNTIFEQESEVNFILFYDYTKIEIEEMLLVIEALYTKMNQLFGEMLNQYLPYPTFFGRRYSSVGLMMYLDNYYKTLLNTLLDPKANVSEDKLVLGWSYNTGFKHKILRNRDIIRNNYNYGLYNDYIELPYWYYELPFLIPAITHEVVSISLRRKGGLFCSEYDDFKKRLQKFFENESNKFVRRIGDILGYEWVVKELSKDIFSDIVSYKIHGFSYILTMFHNLLGENIAKDFLEINYFDDITKSEEYAIFSNDWIFSAKREHNLLRLHFLLALFKKDMKAKKSNTKRAKREEELTEAMQSFLDTIMVLEYNKPAPLDSFEYYYLHNNPANLSTYMAVKLYMQELFYHLLNYPFYHHIDRQLEQEKVLCIVSQNADTSIGVDFQVLWDDRFDVIRRSSYTKVPYKGRFRLEIHKKISHIPYLKDKESVPIKVLTLRKVRKDLVNKVYQYKHKVDAHFLNLGDITPQSYENLKSLESYSIVKEYLALFPYKKEKKLNDYSIKELLNYSIKHNLLKLQEYQEEFTIFYFMKNVDEFAEYFLENLEASTKDEQKVIKWITYGIYDFAYLETKENEVDLYEDTLNSFIDCKLYYFDSKSILMQVEEPIKGKLEASSTDEEKNFSLIVTIELKKAKNKDRFCTANDKEFMNGYNNLAQAIKDLQDTLESFNTNIGRATIYKSLGPKDITVIVENAPIDTLYQIIESINKLSEVNRSFSIFTSQTLDVSLEEEYELNSYIRVPKNSKIFTHDSRASSYKAFENIGKENTISLTTGVMDIKINWKNIKTIRELFKEYQKLIPYMTDYQTKIDKRIYFNTQEA